MAAPDLTLIADIDFRKGSQKLNRQLRNIEKRGINLNTRKSELALGRITGKSNEFQRSLEASNARVIAFGASVAVIEGVRRSFVKLVDTVVQVEAQLTAINSILGRTSGNLQKFGNELFEIAKQTGQAFDLVAETAQEFARQGLSVEQTLKRTNDALILQRLTTLKSEESVASITAALNAFDKQALTSTQVINKLRAVETSFAVSSGDLADALARSASVAQDAGVSFDELLGVITAIKQRTGLGGATIGQGLKTVFTRLNLPTRIEQLRELGVTIDESAGGLEKLRQVSIAVGKAQEQGNKTLATQIGAIAAGQFQISKLSAAFSDLSSQYSVTDAAALKSAQATNEAIIANEEYNETIKSLANSVNQNIGKILTKIGELGGQDAIKDIVKDVNALLEGLQGNKAQAASPIINLISSILKGANEMGILADAARGFVNAISGPGLVAGAAIITNLFKNTLSQGSKSLLQLTGINNAAKRRQDIQKGINTLLSQASSQDQQRLATAKTMAAQQQIILQILQRQVAAQNAIAAGPLASSFGRSLGGRKLAGFGSNFASGNLDPIQKEQGAIKRGVGGASSSAEVKVIPKFNYGSGKVGPAVVNTDEVVIPSKRGDVVLNRDMLKEAKNFALGATFQTNANRLADELFDAVQKNDTPRAQSILARAERASKNLSPADRRQYENIVNSGLKGFPRTPNEPLRSNLGESLGSKNLQQTRITSGRSSGGSSRVDRRGFSTASQNSAAFSRQMREFANDPKSVTGEFALTRKEYLRRGSEGLRSQGSELFDFGPLPKPKQSLRDLVGDVPPQSSPPKKPPAFNPNKLDIKKALAEQGYQREVERFTQGEPVGPAVRREMVKRNIDAEIKQLRKTSGNKNITAEELKRVNPKEYKNLVKRAAAPVVAQQKEIGPIRVQKERAAAARLQRNRDYLARFDAQQEASGKTSRFGIGRKQLTEEQRGRRRMLGQRVQQGAFAGSFALSLASPMIGSAFGGRETETGRRAEGITQGAATGLALGAIGGPYGALAGLLAGGAIGGMAGSQPIPQSQILQEELDGLQEKFTDTTNALGSYINAQADLNQLLESGAASGQAIKQAQKNIQELIRTISEKDSGLGKELAASGSVEESSGIVARFKQQESKRIADLQASTSITRFQESKTGGLGEKAAFGKELIDAGIFKGGAISTLLGDIAGANQATFSKKDVQGLSQTILASTDTEKLFKNIEDSGKTFDEFFRDIAKTTRRGFDGKEMDAFIKELGVSEDVAVALRKFVDEVETGSAVASSAFMGAIQPLKDLRENQLLGSLRFGAQEARTNLGRNQNDLINLIGARSSVDRIAQKGNTRLGFQARSSNLDIISSITGRGNLAARQSLEEDQLESNLKQDEENLVSKFGSEVLSKFQPILESGNKIENRGELVSKLEQLAQGNSNGFSDLAKFAQNDPKILRELELLQNDAAKQLEELKVNSDLAREELSIQQETQSILKNLEGLRDVLEQDFGKSFSDAFGRGDKSIAGQIRKDIGLTSEQEKAALADPNSDINKFLQSSAKQFRGGAEATISTLPKSLQSQAKSVFERGLRESIIPKEFGGGGLDISDAAARNKFAGQRLVEFGRTANQQGLLPENSQFAEALRSFSKKSSGLSSILGAELADTSFKGTTGVIQSVTPQDIARDSEGPLNRRILQEQGQVATSQGKKIQSEEILTLMESYKQDLKDSVIKQGEYIGLLEDLNGKMAEISKQGFETSVSFSDQITVGFQEGGKIVTKKFDSFEGALKALEDRVKRLQARLDGKPVPPPTT